MFRNRYGRLVRPLTGLTACGLAAAALSGPAVAAPSAHRAAAPSAYAFATLNDNADPTFNQLLGINDHGVIAGYFGSGAPGHPNQGYRLHPPYGQSDYVNEDFPGSVQTQVTGLNNRDLSVGFEVDGAGNSSGFVYDGHDYKVVDDPRGVDGGPGGSTSEQLLGVNDRGRAVGFWIDANNVSHGFEAIPTRHGYRFREITIAGETNVAATSINDRGDVAGFASNGGADEGFLIRDKTGAVKPLTGPAGAVSVQALGLNKDREVVGFYTDSIGAQHGFTWSAAAGYATVDDPHQITGVSGAGTTINGVNDQGNLVGFYNDAAGNVDGLLAQKF